MLGANGSAPARAARALCPVLPVLEDGAGVVGWGGRTTPEMAAFANGVLVRYLDYNDTYLSKEPAHPSDNIPAALAAAEAGGKSGRELIAAVAAAYEVQCRLCDAATLRGRGWDHVTWGSFSSTLAASMLLGLSVEETVHALGIAGVSSPALRQTRAGELSMWKGCAFAHAAMNAVFAARLAKNGVTGPAPVFEGEFGVFNLVSGPFTLERFASSREDRFRILDTCIKYYPAEYHAQSAIGAAIELAEEMGEEAEGIEAVTVRTFGAAVEIISGPEKWRPATRESADHSLPFCVAAALLDRNITLATFTERLFDPDILALVDRIRVVKDPELDRLYPEAMPNRVEVTLGSGRFLSRESVYPKGHPKNPLTDEEVEEKFRALGSWFLPGRRLERALGALWRLDEADDVREVMGLFERGA
ncbi:MAG: MmgE/PrpD family protein, partial [Deltaproteobacteria bacterium]|nr:MmgE/PrpD family protein [Deltaproteobacteria bacterium]